MLFYITFIIYLFEIINAKVVINEDNITNYLSENTNEVILNINSAINVTKKININNSIRRLSIIGNSLTSASLKFDFPLNFSSNVEEIEIKSINIDGILFFRNNKRIKLNTVNLSGYIDSNFDTNKNEFIEITKLDYKPAQELVDNCINLSGNVKIDKSSFQGNSSCQTRLLYFNGFSSYTFNLQNSSFNGGKKCSLLDIEYTSEANIEYTHFEEGYSPYKKNGG